MKNTVNILGTQHTVELIPAEEWKFDGTCGRIDHTTKKILIKSEPKENPGNIDYWRNGVLLHELIHGFRYESGFDDLDERLVEWLEIMIPKIMRSVS